MTQLPKEAPEDVHVALMVDAYNQRSQRARSESKALDSGLCVTEGLRVLGLHSTVTGTLPCSFCAATVDPATSSIPVKE